MPILLFIYGTLHPERAPRGIAAVARRLRPVGAGAIRGRLLDLGEYPGVVLDETAQPAMAGGELGDATGRAPQGVTHTAANPAEIPGDVIPGDVFEVPDVETLAELDAYEDYRPEDPEASLFLRVETQVRMKDGRERTCWVYVYNGGTV